MLPFNAARFGNAAAMAPASVTPFSIAFTDHAEDTNALTTYTWSSKNFAVGPAHASRIITVEISSRSTAIQVVSNATIGGVAATKVAEVTNGAGPTNVTSMWQAAVPTGTTAAVSVTFNGAMLRAGVTVHSILGSNGVVPSGGAIAAIAGNSPSASITVPTGGGAIVSSCTNVGAATATATNFSLDLSSTLIGSTLFYASGSDTSHSGATTYTMTWNSAGAAAGVFAAWGP